jgi:tripartite-type tricarboxylate transporter receptor subunit TctC
LEELWQQNESMVFAKSLTSQDKKAAYRRIDVKVFRVLAFLFSVVTFATPAAADNFPSRPIRLIVPYPAGGSTDIMARALQEPMAKILGQPIIIDNRGGAAGTTGSNEAARSDADGYTLLFANNGPISIAPLLQKGVNFDPLKSFAPVSLVSTAPLVLVASEKVPVNDVSGLIAYAKAQSKPMLYASAGPGSLGHLSTERFLNQAGLQMVHVPYRGQAPTTLAIFAGEVDILLTTTSDTLNEYIRSGKVKLLGISSPDASPVAPGAAPIGNALKGFSVETWFGILAPAGTPPEIVSKLNAALSSVLAAPQLRDRFLSYGVEAKASSSAELYGLIAAEIPSWRKVIEERNVKPE